MNSNPDMRTVANNLRTIRRIAEAARFLAIEVIPLPADANAFSVLHASLDAQIVATLDKLDDAYWKGAGK